MYYYLVRKMRKRIEYQHTLRNGLRIVNIQDDSDILMMGFAIGVGARDENTREYGMAHLLEHMLFKGTKKRSSLNIINRIETIGGDFNAYTTKEDTFVYISLPKDYAFRGINMLCDIVSNSQFPDEELAKEKVVIKDEINTYRDSPSELIFDEIENQVFAKSPIGHFILGSERSLDFISRDALMRFYKKHYRADNMVLFILGKIDFDKTVSQVEYLLSDLSISTDYIRKKSDLSINPTHIIHRKSTFQHHYLLATKAYDMKDSRKDALSILSNILGGNSMNSRLNLSLRERNGLVYNVDSAYTAFTDTGIFSINFACAKENSAKALDLVYKELDDIRHNSISAKSLDIAKRQQKGHLMMAMDNRENVFLALGKNYLYHNKFDTMEQIFDRIDRVTIDDISNVAQEIFNKDNFYTLLYK